MRSIEQNRKIHLARRIMRLFAPDFRIVGREDLEPDESVLDLSRKTVEISERSTVEQALCNIMFAVGHLRARSNGRFVEHFAGRGEPESIVSAGVAADIDAAGWAKSMLVDIFRFDLQFAEKHVSDLTWDADDWRNYYGFFIAES